MSLKRAVTGSERTKKALCGTFLSLPSLFFGGPMMVTPVTGHSPYMVLRGKGEKSLPKERALFFDETQRYGPRGPLSPLCR